MKERVKEMNNADRRIESARKMGLANRKYQKKCTFCGKEEHYQHGYCKNCFARYLRKGTAEYKIPKKRKTIPLTENQINKALVLVTASRFDLYKNKLICSETFNSWIKGSTKPTYKKLKRIFVFLNLDIIKELEIEEKYLNIRKYDV